jgi:N-carbamoyl-L-amino-acid hydrolase
MTASPRIDLDRLLGRLDAFNRIGALPGGGNCRLALSDDDAPGATCSCDGCASSA